MALFEMALLRPPLPALGTAAGHLGGAKAFGIDTVPLEGTRTFFGFRQGNPARHA